MSEKIKNAEQSGNDTIHSVSDSVNFWKEAQTFLKSILPEDFQDKLLKYAKEKNFNENEFRLFKNMIEEFIGFEGTMVILKHYH